MMNECGQNKVDLVKKQAQFISLEHEEDLQRSGTLGKDTPNKL